MWLQTSRGRSRSSRSFRYLQRSSWRQVCWSLWQVLFKPECYRWSVDFLLWYAEPCRCTAQRAYEQSKVGLHPCWRRTSKLMFCLKVVLRRTKMWTWLVSSVVKRNWSSFEWGDKKVHHSHQCCCSCLETWHIKLQGVKARPRQSSLLPLPHEITLSRQEQRFQIS